MTCGGLCDTCDGCVDCAPMTSPPRETGASPEAVIREIVYATKCRYEGHESMCNVYGCTRHDHPEVEAIRREVLKAVRSAHLEDARAGCSYCRLDKPVTQVGDGWEHIYKTGPSIPCARPEVWDALSLLPPKGTKP